jgi:putative sterol carrier protein
MLLKERRLKMGYPFPSEGWLKALENVLNTDEKYADTAKKWEGDIIFQIIPDETSPVEETVHFYMDLWHGKCREAKILDKIEGKPDAKFIFEMTRSQAIKVLEGELDPMQAMVTRRLKVRGDIGYMLRHVPIVLDFIRCCRLVEIDE